MIYVAIKGETMRDGYSSEEDYMDEKQENEEIHWSKLFSVGFLAVSIVVILILLFLVKIIFG